jgi:hypothetical protein
MLDGIAAAEILRGVRGANPVAPRCPGGHDREAYRGWWRTFRRSRSSISTRCSPPTSGATAADVRVVLDFNPAVPRYRPKKEDIVGR